MAANWSKIKNEYINSTLSTRDIAKKYKLPYNTVKQKCTDEQWVKLRAEQQRKINAKLTQKTADKIIEKEASRISRIASLADKLLDTAERALDEADMQILEKRITDKITTTNEDGDKLEHTVSDVQIRTEKTNVNITKLKEIAVVLKDIAEISAMASHNPNDNNSEESDMVKAIREAYMESNKNATK